MIAPVAQDMNDADNPPVLQFVEAIADIGAGDPQGGGDLFRRRPPQEKREKRLLAANDTAPGQVVISGSRAAVVSSVTRLLTGR